MIHSRSYAVTFISSFMLPGIDPSYPAGNYTVEADDEQLDLSFAASRRIATTIMLRAGPMVQAWLVKPADLDAALATDADKHRA